MKKPQLKLFILGLLIIAGMEGCKKAEFNDIPVTQDALVGSYKLTALTGKTDNYPEISIYGSVVSDCQKDDVYTLNADLTALYIDAGVKCDVPGDDAAFWSVSGNEITILDEAGHIEHFDGKTLIVSRVDSSQGTTMTIKATYTKQ